MDQEQIFEEVQVFDAAAVMGGRGKVSLLNYNSKFSTPNE